MNTVVLPPIINTFSVHVTPEKVGWTPDYSCNRTYIEVMDSPSEPSEAVGIQMRQIW